MDGLAKLTRLYQIIEKQNQDQVYLDTWVRTQASPCGTIACIGGHAALDPVFMVLGLTMREVKVEASSFTCHEFYPGYKGMARMEALAEFFDLEHWEANSVFGCVSEWEESANGNHREIALRRIRTVAHLKYNVDLGQPQPEPQPEEATT